MKTVCIIQARLGSTRSPGKVLQDIAGESMLARVVQRVRQSCMLDEIVVATTDAPLDDPLVAACRSLGVQAVRGSEQDVLDRYHRAAEAAGADIIVRITADCPLIDAAVLDDVVAAFRREEADYGSNVLERTFPRGLDTEAMTRIALDRAWREASQPFEREHVTPYLYRNPEVFRLCSVRADADYSEHRWTVDTPEDLALVRAIYERLGDKPNCGWRDVLALVRSEPAIAELNRHVQQKPLV